MAETAIITRVLDSVQELAASDWNALLALQPVPTPFMRHEYLSALETSGSATPATGWDGAVVTLWQDGALVAACPVYAKQHSYGEYVFDWAWARAYAQHGLEYYPKGVLAVPFTPVPGSRLLARTSALRQALARAVRQWARERQLSSLHLLFGEAADLAACQADGWMQRSTVQFHWNNLDSGTGYGDFDRFLTALTQDKRKKIRQERRKVAQAGVHFRALQGRSIRDEDWAFFYRCYERTYLEHGNAPYLTPEFFDAMARHLPESWLMFIAERDGRPLAASLVALDAVAAERCQPGGEATDAAPSGTAYGRYWGALERVDCLHFEACYYQPLQWCMAHGIARFEGGAQGEHKMARALLPVVTPSAHWAAHPAFADAIARFLEREGEGMADYVEALQAHSPLRQNAAQEDPA
jgi:predicted N-acyltransferase